MINRTVVFIDVNGPRTDVKELHDGINRPCNVVSPGGMVVLEGDAPVWKYCKMTHKAIMEGAAVVAIAHGMDTTNPDVAPIVAYSRDEEYRIGQAIPKGICGIGDNIGNLPEF